MLYILFQMLHNVIIFDEKWQNLLTSVISYKAIRGTKNLNAAVGGERWYDHFLNGVDSSNKARKATKIT